MCGNALASFGGFETNIYVSGIQNTNTREERLPFTNIEKSR
jgi:hypothetical protein